MNKLDDDIRNALANGNGTYDADREEGLLREWIGIYRGKMRWWAVFVTVESFVVLALMVLAVIEFFETDDTRWQIFYATGVLLLAMVLLLVLGLVVGLRMTTARICYQRPLRGRRGWRRSESRGQEADAGVLDSTLRRPEGARLGGAPRSAAAAGGW